MLSEQNFFETFTRLTGKAVKVVVVSKRESDQTKSKILEGIVTNCMFDSFILETKTSKEIVAFSDLTMFEEAV